MDPEMEEHKLAVIDSGTTLVILPFLIYENFITTLAEQFRDDEEIDLVCSRYNESGQMDHCYFNNTLCTDLVDDHGYKFSNLELQLGDYVFRQNLTTTFRDGNNTVEDTHSIVPACSIGLRGQQDDYLKLGRSRFLVGNIFLKNFYSVYDYDTQEVRLGVNIHSEGIASIDRYDSNTWSEDNGYTHLSEHDQHWKRSTRNDW